MAVKYLSELHDARLIGIAYLPNDQIRLDFEGVQAVRSLLLKGVVNFYCTGMLEGNIVGSVEILDPADISVEDLRHFVKAEGRGQSTDTLSNNVTRKQLCMILLSPSYGAELGCVCQSILTD